MKEVAAILNLYLVQLHAIFLLNSSTRTSKPDSDESPGWQNEPTRGESVGKDVDRKVEEEENDNDENDEISLNNRKMSMNQFLSICGKCRLFEGGDKGRMNLQGSTDEKNCIFAFFASNLIVSDEVPCSYMGDVENPYSSITFESFLEALVRVADMTMFPQLAHLKRPLASVKLKALMVLLLHAYKPKILGHIDRVEKFRSSPSFLQEQYKFKRSLKKKLNFCFF